MNRLLLPTVPGDGAPRWTLGSSPVGWEHLVPRSHPTGSPCSPAAHHAPCHAGGSPGWNTTWLLTTCDPAMQTDPGQSDAGRCAGCPPWQTIRGGRDVHGLLQSWTDHSLIHSFPRSGLGVRLA